MMEDFNKIILDSEIETAKFIENSHSKNIVLRSVPKPGLFCHLFHKKTYNKLNFYKKQCICHKCLVIWTSFK